MEDWGEEGEVEEDVLEGHAVFLDEDDVFLGAGEGLGEESEAAFGFFAGGDFDFGEFDFEFGGVGGFEAVDVVDAIFVLEGDFLVVWLFSGEAQVVFF